jgi:hypothetical protein
MCVLCAVTNFDDCSFFKLGPFHLRSARFSKRGHHGHGLFQHPRLFTAVTAYDAGFLLE